MTAPVLETRRLVRTFGGRSGFLRKTSPPVYAVNEVDLAVHEGETLGIVGESGCGKSTLGRMMTGLDRPTAGQVLFHGEDLTSLRKQNPRKLFSRIQFVFQDPLSSLNPRKTVRQILETPLKHLLKLPKSERPERLRKLMEEVRLLPEFLERHPHEFSGGQAQRIGIARALAVQPEVLVLDEPVSALDVSVQAQVLHLLRALKAEFHLTYVFISHDLAVVEHLCDTVAVMYLGRIMELAPSQELFQRPRHPYTRLLLSSVPVPGRKSIPAAERTGEPPDPSDPPPGCPFAPRCPRWQNRCRDQRPELALRGGEFPVACFFPHSENAT